MQEPSQKGQVTFHEMPRTILIVTIAIIFVALTGTVLEKIQDTQTELVSTRITNETFTAILYGSLYNLSNDNVINIVAVHNTTETLGSGNYSRSGKTFNLTYSTVINRTLNFSSSAIVNSSEAQILEIVDAYNYTDGVRFTAGNFTISDSGRNNITNATELINFGNDTRILLNITWRYVRYNNSHLNVTYDYERTDYPTAANITGEGLKGTETFADFFEPIVVVVAAVILIGIILGGLMIRTARRQSSAAGV